MHTDVYPHNVTKTCLEEKERRLMEYFHQELKFTYATMIHLISTETC